MTIAQLRAINIYVPSPCKALADIQEFPGDMYYRTMLSCVDFYGEAKKKILDNIEDQEAVPVVRWSKTRDSEGSQSQHCHRISEA